MTVPETHRRLPPSTVREAAAFSELEKLILANVPQGDLPVHHTLHGGVYTRTATYPADSRLVTALIKVPTTLVICGDATYGDTRYTGHAIVPSSAWRKGAWVIHEQTTITMVFTTDAKSVAEAEAEMTDDILLQSTNDTHDITGV